MKNKQLKPKKKTQKKSDKARTETGIEINMHLGHEYFVMRRFALQL